MRYSVFLIAVLACFSSFAQSGNVVPQTIPCLHIDHQSNGAFNGIYYNQDCIYIGNTSGTTQIITNGNQYVRFQAGEEVGLSPNSLYKANGQSEVHAKIEKYPVEAAWFAPNNTPGFVGHFKRLEIGFKLPKEFNQQVNQFLNNSGGGLNPFDEADVDFRVKLTAPNGVQTTRFAFYYIPCNTNLNGTWDSPAYQNNWSHDTTSYPWRFRFAPDQLGLWNASIEVIRQGTVVYTQPAFSFVCIPSEHQGYLETTHNYSNQDRWMYYSKTGNTFPVVGTNIANTGVSFLPSDAKRQLEALQALIGAGGNFVRIELGGQNALPDFPDCKNYIGKMGQMYAYDKLFAECEKYGVYISLFRHHVEVEEGQSWMPVRWGNNPYSTELGGSVYSYFDTQNPVIQRWQKNNLRYIFSRWGYSANMAFYGYSEFEGWTNLLKDVMSGSDAERRREAASLMNHWIGVQQSYIRNELKSGHTMFCHTAAALETHYLDEPGGVPTPSWSPFLHSDIVGLHSYETEKDMNFKNRRKDLSEKYWNKYHMPVLFDEVGLQAGAGGDYIDIYCCTGIDFHNEVWATALMGTAGTGLNWWWEQLYSQGYQNDLKFVTGFFAGENLRSGDYRSEIFDDATFVKNRKIENYHLVAANQERVLGWLHNATYYWRNMAGTGTCVQNLLEGAQSSNPPCIISEDPYGFPPGSGQFPWLYVDANQYGNTDANYASPNYADNFTPNGSAVGSNTDYKIKGLKPQQWFSAKHHWYRIDYYYTCGTSGWGQVIPGMSAWEHTNLAGNLKPKVPNLDGTNPDYAYKVTYLGKYKSNLPDSLIAPVEISHPEQPRITELKVYPNPNTGQFTIELTEEMESVLIYSVKGDLVYVAEDIRTERLNVDLSNCERGTYLVQIATKSGNYYTKLIERL